MSFDLEAKSMYTFQKEKKKKKKKKRKKELGIGG